VLYAKISFEVGGIGALLQLMGGELRESESFGVLKEALHTLSRYKAYY
jgi:hypothetical protein